METTEGKVLWKLILMLLWEHSSFVLVNYPILWRPLEPLVCWRILETVLKSSYHIFVYPPWLFGSMSAIKHILNKTEVNKDFKYECIYLENFPIISCYHSWSCFPPKAAEDKPSFYNDVKLWESGLGPSWCVMTQILSGEPTQQSVMAWPPPIHPFIHPPPQRDCHYILCLRSCYIIFHMSSLTAALCRKISVTTTTTVEVQALQVITERWSYPAQWDTGFFPTYPPLPGLDQIRSSWWSHSVISGTECHWGKKKPVISVAP